jgi:hypothetical protein
MALKTRENSPTPCPSCDQGMAHLTGMRVQGTLRVFSYTCTTCDYSWQDSVRWLDEWWAGTFTERKLIRDEAGAGKKPDS